LAHGKQGRLIITGSYIVAILLTKATHTFRNHRHHAVWIPAFAGTTEERARHTMSYAGACPDMIGDDPPAGPKARVSITLHEKSLSKKMDSRAFASPKGLPQAGQARL
jgi:hypothetical protein